MLSRRMSLWEATVSQPEGYVSVRMRMWLARLREFLSVKYVPKTIYECPIPRCAIEVYIALDAIMVGLGIINFGDSRLALGLIFDGSFTLNMVRNVWGFSLIGCGLFQLFAVKYGGFTMLRVAALMGAMAWFALFYTAVWGNMRSIAMPSAGLNVCGQLFIFWMLRGGKWQRSSR